MSRLEKYSSYKDSGVEWLGKIPYNWEIKKLKFIANNKTIKSVESDFKIALENIESQTTKYIETQEIVFSEAGINFKKGDVLFGKLRPYLAKVYLAEKDGLCVSEFLVLESKQIKNLFLKYLLVSYSCIEHINSSTYGTKMPRASWNFIGNSLIPIPPKHEQTLIASFLDEKTAKIDEAISQKQKLIELLKERRQIVINDAVTKGLDKTVEFVDSGVEWIGEIPKGWEINRLKFLFKIRKRIANSLGYDVLSITQKGIKVKDIDSGEGQLAMDYSKYQLAFKDDFAMNHMDLLTGYIDISKFDGVISPDYRVFTLEDSNCIPDYYLRLFQMCYHEKIFYAFGQGVSQLGRWRFPADNFNNFFVPLPPKHEQLQIVEYIETQTTKIDKAIELQQNYIAKLKEYKATLIDSVVTGKVRVV